LMSSSSSSLPLLPLDNDDDLALRLAERFYNWYSDNSNHNTMRFESIHNTFSSKNYDDTCNHTC
jgi:hypothetical protein